MNPVGELNASFPLTIFYDASCGLCRQEMHTIKRYDRHERLRLVDCSAADFDDAPARQEGVSQADMMRLIRARDADGRWLVGIDVFVLAYRATDNLLVSGLWAHAWLRPLWDRLYPWVARYRMPLSRMGFTGLFNRLVNWSAARAHRRSAACRDGQCTLD